MAVDLLSLAGALSKSLHNTPTSTKRNNSYAPGTSYGNKIPGTGLKKGQGLSNLASKGRRGDTKIRKVKGRTSHVNATEASVIDSLGPLGEAWVDNIGSGTINPKTGLPEYGFGSWLKKRVTPPKKVMAALKKGDLGAAAGSMWDTNKGAIVGMALGGPLGAMAGQGIMEARKGSSGTWKPSEGKWGIFGQTGASKKRDTAKSEAKARHTQFEGFRRDYEDQNIAGIFTEDTEDNTDLTADFSGSSGFNNMITTHSGLDASSNDIADYTDEYDDRKETELADNVERDLKAINIHGKALEQKKTDIGTGLSSGMFGLLTESQDSTTGKGFAGSGDFAADFKKKTAIKEAESQLGGADLEQESIELEKESVVADAMSGTQDLHEDYNQEFWENMMTWDTAINS